MVLFLPSPSGIATGEAEAVGVRYVPATEKNPPLRVYYPATSAGKEVGYFQDTSAACFLQGYWGVLRSRKRDGILFQLGLGFLRIASWFFPLSYLKVPGVYLNASVSKSTTPSKLPLILFSHGLTGTGQENSILLSAWAKQGYVVISVHHMDGSSSCVPKTDGSNLWYNPGPPFSKYDVNFRPNQMEIRVKELMQARDWLADSAKNIPDLDSKVDRDKTIVSGFSYGAATTALLAAKKVLPSLKAVILLDGWFHIDIESAGIEFEMPKQAFEATHLKEIPAILINSQVFSTYGKLWKATNKLAGQFNADPPHLIPDTSHNNFCDLAFWFPAIFLQKLGAIGTAEPRQAYASIVGLTIDFLKKQQSL